VNTPIDDRP